jgi:hypothetical protein
MQIQNIEFSKLKSFLNSIEISDELACFDIEEDYDEVLRTKKHSDLTTWIPTFNRKSSESFFTTFKTLQNEMFKEISVNRLLKIDKSLILNYFKDLFNFFTEISNKITYDVILNKWACGFCYFNDQFLQNKLNEHFNQKIQYFYKELNDNIIAVMVHLNEIEEYNACVINIKTSPQGNSKIKWTKNTNQLVYFFLELKEDGIIDTTQDNLKRFIINNFLDKDDMELNEYTIDTYFKPSAGKYPKRGRVDPQNFLKPEEDSLI